MSAIILQLTDDNDESLPDCTILLLKTRADTSDSLKQ